MKIRSAYIIYLTAITLVFSLLSYASARTSVCNGKIAFASNQDGHYEIYTMEADGSDVQQLTFNAADEDFPVWSPDGKHILFSSDRTGISEIFMMNDDGSNPVSLTPGQPSFGGRWSPDGMKIAYTVNTNSSGKNIYMMNEDGSNKINLTNDIRSINTLPFWSTDGSDIFFLTDRDYPIGTGADAPNLDLYMMNADGSNPTRLFGVGIGITAIDLSPDGTRIAFGAWRLGPAMIIRDLNTFQDEVLADGMEIGGADPSWSPDGNKIVFNNDGFRLATMNSDGANLTILLTVEPPIELQSLDWQPLDCDIE